MSPQNERSEGAQLGEQFRLARLQTFRWGTFDGVSDVRIPAAGYLFVGPSGSGKSTLLDAHAALLTPPKWVDFNVAAREAERSGKDRNVMSYLRGAWAQQTGDNGEYQVQYLRPGTTWSAIAETYRNGQGRVVTLAQVLWVRGTTTATTDVKRLYLVLQREFDMKELDFFVKSDFDVRRFKHELPDATIKDEFGGYQERFRGLMGIETERALRLLHKTQSAKNLGDLNVFLRDFMLDAPETFAAAERLVNEFGELHAAHQAVVSARKQIETLMPARARHEELLLCRRDKSVLDELTAGLDGYSEQRRHTLVSARIDELTIEVDVAAQEALRLTTMADHEFDTLCHLKAMREGLGGAISQLKQQLHAASTELPLRKQKHALASVACRALKLDPPADAEQFVRAVASAKARLDHAEQRSVELIRSRDDLKEQQRKATAEFQDVCAEVDAMERQRSNIPASMLALRANISRALGLAEEKLPFAGELIEVKKDQASWQGAIERVLHGFALSLLVDDKHCSAVASYVNEHHLGQRLVYYRLLPREEGRRSPGPSSLYRKLAVAQVSQASWLREELMERFDYECVENLTGLRNASRAITREGLVKQGQLRHEKDDRHRVDDRRRWVLGFDNGEKLRLYKEQAGKLADTLSELQEQLATLQAAGSTQRDELLQAQSLVNLSWSEVDVGALAARIDSLHRQIEAEASARPELAVLDEKIAAQQTEHAAIARKRDAAELRGKHAEGERARQRRALDGLNELHLALFLTPTQLEGLERRFLACARPVNLETIQALTLEVSRSLHKEQGEYQLRMNQLRNDIERQLEAFNRLWPAESDGLDPTLASAEDYLIKLTRLETDGLPRHEERFMQLLREQSDQNLTLLSTRLDLERTAIRDRLELVNESLLGAPFNPGTHLVIEPLDRPLEEVRQFKQTLKEALSQSFSDDSGHAERRFTALSSLVRRLSSQEGPDRSWRNLVLDVRQHVEFVARELDQNDEEVEVYRSGAGKSGGQRQKLAATCLAAALRYQLGGQDRALPTFATVVLDEAFDKADAEFTSMAMNIFKTFGFQMIVATPLKSVMTLEPFIGGACFVHIKDRKSSAMLIIDYDEDARRLKLPEELRDGQEAPLS